jgi:hypothetical protein
MNALIDEFNVVLDETDIIDLKQSFTNGAFSQDRFHPFKRVGCRKLLNQLLVLMFLKRGIEFGLCC